MLVNKGENFQSSFERHYDLESRDNQPLAVLKQVSFFCKICTKNAYVDLSVVPAQTLNINCPICGRELFTLQEEEFEVVVASPFTAEIM